MRFKLETFECSSLPSGFLIKWLHAVCDVEFLLFLCIWRHIIDASPSNGPLDVSVNYLLVFFSVSFFFNNTKRQLLWNIVNTFCSTNEQGKRECCEWDGSEYRIIHDNKQNRPYRSLNPFHCSPILDGEWNTMVFYFPPSWSNRNPNDENNNDKTICKACLCMLVHLKVRTCACLCMCACVYACACVNTF